MSQEERHTSKMKKMIKGNFDLFLKNSLVLSHLKINISKIFYYMLSNMFPIEKSVSNFNYFRNVATPFHLQEISPK